MLCKLWHLFILEPSPKLSSVTGGPSSRGALAHLLSAHATSSHVSKLSRASHRETAIVPDRTSGSELSWTWRCLPGLLCTLGKTPKVLPVTDLASWAWAWLLERGPTLSSQQPPRLGIFVQHTNCTTGFSLRQFEEWDKTSVNASFHVPSLLRERGDDYKLTQLHWFYSQISLTWES